jgi:serine/threonine-protein kinase SRK2
MHAHPGVAESALSMCAEYIKLRFCSCKDLTLRVYVLQEVLKAPQVYDGKAADVWSAGVHLYIMLVGWYPFTDPRDPKNFPKTAQSISNGTYSFPSDLNLTSECQDLVKKMLDKDAARRITIQEIQKHPWFLKNLSRELMVCSF